MQFKLKGHLVSIEVIEHKHLAVNITRLEDNGGIPQTVTFLLDSNATYTRLMIKVERIISLEPQLFSIMAEHTLEGGPDLVLAEN